MEYVNFLILILLRVSRDQPSNSFRAHFQSIWITLGVSHSSTIKGGRFKNVPWLLTHYTVHLKLREHSVNYHGMKTLKIKFN